MSQSILQTTHYKSIIEPTHLLTMKSIHFVDLNASTLWTCYKSSLKDGTHPLCGLDRLESIHFMDLS